MDKRRWRKTLVLRKLIKKEAVQEVFCGPYVGRDWGNGGEKKTGRLGSVRIKGWEKGKTIGKKNRGMLKACISCRRERRKALCFVDRTR